MVECKSRNSPSIYNNIIVVLIPSTLQFNSKNVYLHAHWSFKSEDGEACPPCYFTFLDSFLPAWFCISWEKKSTQLLAVMSVDTCPHLLKWCNISSTTWVPTLCVVIHTKFPYDWGKNSTIIPSIHRPPSMLSLLLYTTITPKYQKYIHRS
jgi:hypothetical protein